MTDMNEMLDVNTDYSISSSVHHSIKGVWQFVVTQACKINPRNVNGVRMGVGEGWRRSEEHTSELQSR